MERIQSKIEGKGNGIKTVIVNLSSVAHSLARPPACKLTLTPCLSLLTWVGEKNKISNHGPK